MTAVHASRTASRQTPVSDTGVVAGTDESLLLPARPPWLRRRVLRLRKYWYRRIRPDRVRLNGVSIAIDRQAFSDKIVRRLYDGGYEAEECQALAKTLGATDRMLELGSGLGYLSTFAARRIGSEQVTTCEANPHLIPVIERTFRDNRVAPRLLQGVMTRDGRAGETCPFYVHKRNFWSSSLSDLGTDFRRTAVPCMHWDTMLATLRPSYLVMDIEGGEIALLQDFDAPFVDKLLVEFHPQKTGEIGIERVFAQLAERGFERTRVTAGAHVYYFARPATAAGDASSRAQAF
ncbi:FkbM family methyltransferase [Salinisphaera sp. Q1T1-3]|uniref:FkbM family methyltransferase n=1 Tax=Salinisphaera sp. Q1T1-3 TaxID=2321229 RepID=UPI000E74E6DC|nr:FkbM family methyltransferase [Salinisphaera sp. Q1T1-3]RJS92838.1 hypothetical protein D3260_09775 [Salinisphaera sp. Q1T1-3]